MEKNLIPDLITYAETLPDGSMLKDIAYATIKELSRENPFGRCKPRRPQYKADGFIHRETGKYMVSLRDMANHFGIRYDYLLYDINSGNFKYGIYVC